MRYAFIAQQRLSQRQHSVQAYAKALQISRSGYYDWVKRCHTPSQRALANNALLVQIQAVHTINGVRLH